ncbi:5-hydroxytryptamine receptor 3A-like [Bufo gargarizans]|uniref:5-hydroxytryptamine receptor 3A-like n=1 Tax=Bufo gargarizans TaxID=30331 RepID=UPI001CF34903|nr:5-hydroxytryptamine receptor 3A-like [Bufo gargarizans]
MSQQHLTNQLSLSEPQILPRSSGPPAPFLVDCLKDVPGVVRRNSSLQNTEYDCLCLQTLFFETRQVQPKQPHKTGTLILPCTLTEELEDVLLHLGKTSTPGSTSLTGVGYCQTDCSFQHLIKNLEFPNPNIRPVKIWNTTTTVTIGMKLYAVIKLDTMLQSLTTLIWFSMTWENEFLNWNISEYCNIRKLFLSNFTIWQPDLYIYERTDSDDKSPVVPFYSLNHTGSTNIAKPMRIISACKLDVFKFPFDTQKCNLTFGSYIHPDNAIVMFSSDDSNKVLSDSQYIFASNGEWELLDITVKNDSRNVLGTNYSSVYYKITVKRTPTSYILTLIVPACFMVILDIISMLIPMDREGRLGFKIAIVLGFSVLLLILNNLLPSSDKAPLLGIFCCLCMAGMVISIIGAIAISHMLMLSESQPTVPSWMKTWILGRLAYVLCFKGKTFMKYGIKLSEAETYHNKRAVEQSLKTKSSQRNTDGSIEVKLLKMLLREVLRIHKEIIDTREMDEVKTEWHAAALVVDRLVFITYLIFLVIIFSALLITWLT